VTDTWATALARLALILGGDSEQFRCEAEEWVREAVAHAWRVESLHDLAPMERRVAFQRLLGVVHDLAGEGDLAFAANHRDVVAQALARRFALHHPPDGPAWRLAPAEPRPTWDEFCSFGDFGATAGGARVLDPDRLPPYSPRGDARSE
jgi:hypothetical protein